MSHTSQKFKTLILFFVCISVSLGTAVSAVGRAALYLLALWILMQSVMYSASYKKDSINTGRHTWVYLVIATVAFMALSLTWSEANATKAVASWTRHARLISIPIVWMLLRNREDAHKALRVFIWAQLFVLASSWLQVMHFDIPWSTAPHGIDDSPYYDYVVFGSYLEQSIMEAILAVLLWHQREWIFGSKGRWLAVATALITVVHVLTYVPGRTGHLVLLALISLAIFYELPSKNRWLAIMAPIIFGGIAMSFFPLAQHRIMLTYNEIIAFNQHADINSSSGERLYYWLTSLRSIADHPWLGSGSGSWNAELHRLAGNTNIDTFQTVDNPHQLFLLWLVESGFVGLSLLCATLLSMYLFSKALTRENALSLQSALLGLVVASLSTSTIYGIGLGDFFCVLIGILLATGHGRNATTLKPSAIAPQT